MAASMRENAVQNLEVIESLTILRGLQLCMHLDLPNLIIESDCHMVV